MSQVTSPAEAMGPFLPEAAPMGPFPAEPAATAAYAEPAYADEGYWEPAYAEPAAADQGYWEPAYAGPAYAAAAYAEPAYYAEPAQYESSSAHPASNDKFCVAPPPTSFPVPERTFIPELDKELFGTGDVTDSPILEDVFPNGDLNPLDLLRPPVQGVVWAYGDGRPSASEMDAGVYGLAGVFDSNDVVRRNIAFTSLVPGETFTSLVKEGQFVKKGDPLFVIGNTEREGALKQAQQAVEGAELFVGSAISQAGREIEQDRSDVTDKKDAALEKIATFESDIEALDTDLSTLGEDIALQEDVISTAQARLDRALLSQQRYRDLAAVGAIPDDELKVNTEEVSEATAHLSRAKQGLITLENKAPDILNRQDDKRASIARLSESLPRYDAQIAQIDGFTGLDKSQVIDAVRDPDPDNPVYVPSSVARAVNDVGAAKIQLETAEAAVEALTKRATQDGRVIQVLPEGLVLNQLNGSAFIRDDDSTNFGTVEEDPERRLEVEGRDGATTTIIPDPTAQAQLQIVGMDKAQADEFTEDETIAFRTSDGKLGYAEVFSVFPDGKSYKVKFTNPRFIDGEPLLAAEREPIQIFKDETPDFTRGTYQTSDTVTIGEVAANSVRANRVTETPEVTLEGGEFPVVQEEFEAVIPVFADGGSKGRPADKVQVGELYVQGTTAANVREVEVVEVTGRFVPSGENVNAGTIVKIDLTPEDATQPNFGAESGGSAREGSGAIIRASVPFITQNGALSNARADGGDFRIGSKPDFSDKSPEAKEGEHESAEDREARKGPLEKAAGVLERLGADFSKSWNHSDSFTVSELPVEEQLSIPIYVTPSGIIGEHDDSVRISTPSEIWATGPGAPLPTAKELRDRTDE